MAHEKFVDKLESIFNDQKAFQDFRNKFNNQYSVADTKEMILALYDEVSDLLNCFKWKPSEKPSNEFVIGNVHEELIDVLKYWLVVANIWGLTPEKIAEEYFKKSTVVEQRWKQEFDLNLGDERCVVFDIDGVLCDYVGTWYKFLSKEKLVPLIERDALETLDLSTTVAAGTYVELKDKFRRTGEKQDALVIDGARQLLIAMRQSGHKIVLVSARPVKEYYRIFPDTIQWLKKNGLEYDAIFFEENKREWVLGHLKNVIFCVEDDPKQVEKLANGGLDVYMPLTGYNKSTLLPSSVRRIRALEEIFIEQEKARAQERTL